MPSSGATTAGSVLHSARAYDVGVWVLTLGRERRFRERLVALAQLRPGEAVLDVGCGTGSLAIEAARRVGSGGVVAGVDPSPEMVGRARRKARKAGVDVWFDAAGIEALPFADGTFDVVVGTLMLHHLSEDGRRQGVEDVARVLKAGGRFLAVDLGGGGHGKCHGLFHRMPNHASFHLDQVTPVLESAGLRPVERGPVGSPAVVGLSDLRFVLAMTSPAGS